MKLPNFLTRSVTRDDGAAVFRPLRFRRSGRGGDVLRGEVHLVGKQGHEAVGEVRLRGGGVVFLQLFPCGVAVGNDDADGVPLRGGVDDAGHGGQPALELARMQPLRRAHRHAHSFRPGDDVGGRGVHKQAPFIHDEGSVAVGRFVHVGGADQYPHAFLSGELFQDAPQFPPGERIHAHGGFIQQDEGRGGDQGTAQAQLLLHAAGELSRKPRGEAFQAGHGEQAAEALFPVLAVNAVHAGVKLHVFSDGKVFIKPEFLRHVAYGGLDGPAFFHGVQIQDGDRPAMRFHQSRDEADQSGFSRSVRPQQPYDFPGGQAEGDVVHRRKGDAGGVRKYFPDVPAVNQGLGFRGHGLGCSGGCVPAFWSRGMVTVAGAPRRSRLSGSSTMMRTS